MKRCFPILFILLLTVSCHKALLPGTGRHDNWDPHSDHSFHRNLPEPAPDSVLLTAVEYPSGYDWVRDSAHSIINAHILMLRGETELLRIPAGADSPWTADPDCHRILDGHLYTFTTIDGCTVIGRDGEEVLRYSAAESIRGFAVEDGRILTLGQNLDGRGLSFRRDGRVLFLSDGGTVCGSLDRGLPPSGALYKDREHWYFSYKEDGRIHLVEDNLERALPDDNILDVRVHRGMMMLASARKTNGRTVITLTMGSYSLSLSPAFYKDVRSARFVCDGNQARLIADVAGVSYVWNAGNSRLIESVRDSYFELYPRPGRDASVITEKGRVVLIDPYGEPPGEYCFVSGACAASAGNSFFVALSSLNGGPGLLLRDSLQTVCNINGPITSLCLE